MLSDVLLLFFEEHRQHQMVLICLAILIPPVLTKSWHHNYYLQVPDDIGKQNEKFRDTSCNIIITGAGSWVKYRGEE